MINNWTISDYSTNDNALVCTPKTVAQDSHRCDKSYSLKNNKITTMHVQLLRGKSRPSVQTVQ